MRWVTVLRYNLGKRSRLATAQFETRLADNLNPNSICRPRGLTIGNLTSQFGANCYLHGLDLFIKRQRGCKGYLRYVDDFALFHQDKCVLLVWTHRIIERLQGFRLRIHENRAHVIPCAVGIPWLGFVVYPDYMKVKARKVVHGRKRLNRRYG